MRIAADRLAQVTSRPAASIVIVCEDADLEIATRARLARYLNAGQVCTSRADLRGREHRRRVTQRFVERRGRSASVTA